MVLFSLPGFASRSVGGCVLDAGEGVGGDVLDVVVPGELVVAAVPGAAAAHAPVGLQDCLQDRDGVGGGLTDVAEVPDGGDPGGVGLPRCVAAAVQHLDEHREGVGVVTGDAPQGVRGLGPDLGVDVGEEATDGVH